jgi:hypothetical protein
MGDMSTRYKEGNWPHSHLLHTTNWAKSRHRDVSISPEEWKSETWIKGEQAAAEIIGIETSELKNITLFRALFQDHCNEEYIKHCLGRNDIDINWRFGCGKSIFGAAAMYDIASTQYRCKLDSSRWP